MRLKRIVLTNKLVFGLKDSIKGWSSLQVFVLEPAPYHRAFFHREYLRPTPAELLPECVIFTVK